MWRVELVYQLKDSGARLLLTGMDSVENALKAAKEVGIPRNRIFTFCDPDGQHKDPHPSGLKPWTSFWVSPNEAKPWQWRKITSKEEAQNTTCIINYSSGTTGLPKGVEISHFGLIANAEQVLHKKRLVA